MVENTTNHLLFTYAFSMDQSINTIYVEQNTVLNTLEQKN